VKTEITVDNIKNVLAFCCFWEWFANQNYLMMSPLQINLLNDTIHAFPVDSSNWMAKESTSLMLSITCDSVS
jgi:hypothetical protein